jgi:hypothetical protein
MLSTLNGRAHPTKFLKVYDLSLSLITTTGTSTTSVSKMGPVCFLQQGISQWFTPSAPPLHTPRPSLQQHAVAEFALSSKRKYFEKKKAPTPPLWGIHWLKLCGKKRSLLGLKKIIQKVGQDEEGEAFREWEWEWSAC